MLRSQRLSGAALALLLRFELVDPAPDGTFAKFHVFTDLTDAQALDFDHLSYLQLEAGIKGSSGFLVIHFCRHLGLENLSLCLFKLDHHSLCTDLYSISAPVLERCYRVNSRSGGTDV
jgi:hypothetical protein